MSRAGLRRMAQSAVVARAVALLERCDSASPRILRVLTYHRVDEAQPFARQMEYLATRYRVVSIAEVLTALDGGPALPPRAVLLSFDDAYTSFAALAWPILRRHGFSAALFVPTAYPGSDAPRFWWDRLAQAFARTTRVEAELAPFGRLTLATSAERARAHALVKRHVKDLAHVETLARTEEVCAALGVAREEHEVLGWEELRALAAEGVALGAHTRTHPRLDRVSPAEARAEILGSLADLEREVPGAPRLFAYPDGRFDDELVELLRATGVELAFTTRRGTNDLFARDRLRLRRMHVEASDPVAVLRARLVFSAARLDPALRLVDPPSPHERAAERSARRERRRTRILLRSLDAAVTAGLRAPAGAFARLCRVGAPRTSHYERVGQAVRLATSAVPALERRLQDTLFDTTRLALRATRVTPIGFGSGSTVFRLDAPGSEARVLKVYRRSLGREPARLAAMARRHRERHRRLREHYGEVVLPARFLVVHGPLRGVPAVACLQRFLPGELEDVLEFEDQALLARLSAHGLTPAFAEFARRTLAWRARGTFPDLFGRGNLVLAREREGARLWLIDSGILDAREAPLAGVLRERIDTLTKRLEHLLERMGTHALAGV